MRRLVRFALTHRGRRAALAAGSASVRTVGAGPPPAAAAGHPDGGDGSRPSSSIGRPATRTRWPRPRPR